MIALLLVVTLAGRPAPGRAPAPAPEASPAVVEVGLRRTVELERAGVTAAYAVDDTLVEAAADAGLVRLFGLRPGTTAVTLVGPSGVETLSVRVLAPPRRVAASGPAAARGTSAAQAGYDSQTGRLSVGVETETRSGSRAYRLRAASVTGVGSVAGSEKGTALPELALGVESGGRSFVLGDERPVVSPLTVSGASLRGMHWTADRWRVHAGWTSATLYEDLLLAVERESAAGVSYRARRGGSTLMPSLYFFPGSSPYGGSRGALGSLLAGFGGSGRLAGEAELGYAGRPVAAGELSFRGSGLQAHLEGRRQPAGTASLGLGRPHGTFLAGDVSERLRERLIVATSFSLDRSEGAFARRSDAASAELRFQPTRRLRLRGGARLGSYDPDGEAPAARTLTVPFEAAWEGARGGVSAVYRLEDRSGAVGARSGGRVGAHLRFPGLRAGAFADWQPSAVSLDTVLGAQPGLARALAELSLTAHTPDDLARLLRENAALADLGYFDPASVRFDAARRQLGVDVAWSPAPAHRLSARVLLDRTSVAEATRTTSLATLGYSRDVAGFELFGSLGLYARGGGVSHAEPSFRIGIRGRFDGLAGPLRLGHRPLTGYVFRDDSASGRAGGNPIGVPGAEVRLDDGRFTFTDAQGRFRFEDARRGVRRVEVAPLAGTYFTTPSAVEVAPGRDAAFGIAFSPARLVGVVRDDAGAGVAGVRLRLSSAAASESATTDSLGRFAFAVSAGEYTLTVESGSLAAGYAAPRGEGWRVRLSPEAPVHQEIEVLAQRSLGGRLAAACPEAARVCLLEAGRCTTPEPDGRYVFRGVRTGPHTVVGEACGRAASRAAVVPASPGPVGGVDFDLR